MSKKINILFFTIVVAILIVFIILMTKLSTLKQTSILIGSTTSLQDSGLLDEILPLFYEETGISTKVIAVGTGQAMKLGEDGEVDALLVHNKPAEIAFVEAGYGTKRWDVMYNDFVLVGPFEDPLGLKEKAKDDIGAAFALILEEEAVFVSRGDESGTHKKELEIWQDIKREPVYNQYVSAGKGMGDVLKMADELRGYTLTDRATYLKLSKGLELDVIIENDERLINMYGAIVIDPNVTKHTNSNVGAQRFVKWILSPEIQKKIGEYGVDVYGKGLFIPCGEEF